MPDLIEIARAALLEITQESTIGELSEQTDEVDGVTTVTFASKLAGYPGWHWTVSLATVDGSDPTVLEAELMPGDGALLAPDWVPWSERLAEWQAAQEALAAEAAEAESGDDEPDDDEDEDDEDALGSDVLHGGDLDGVDIDIDEHDDDVDDDGDDFDDDDTDLDDDGEEEAD